MTDTGMWTAYQSLDEAKAAMSVDALALWGDLEYWQSQHTENGKKPTKVRIYTEDLTAQQAEDVRAGLKELSRIAVRLHTRPDWLPENEPWGDDRVWETPLIVFELVAEDDDVLAWADIEVLGGTA